MGIMFSAIGQSFPPKSKFSANDIPDLTGQVIIVTGGNSGVGKETAKALLQHNAKVYIAARSEEKAKDAIKDLKSQTGKEAELLLVDLADLHSIKRAASEFTQKENRLHVLFNNGGVMIPPIDQLTAQNFDLQFGTNVLGHFYLTKLLLPTLLATATAEKPARVINTSSLASLVGTIDFNTVKDSPARKKAGASKLYGQSKLGNVLFSNELQRRYADQNIVSVSLNPGNLKTELQRHVPGLARSIMNSTPVPRVIRCADAVVGRHDGRGQDARREVPDTVGAYRYGESRCAESGHTESVVDVAGGAGRRCLILKGRREARRNATIIVYSMHGDPILLDTLSQNFDYLNTADGGFNSPVLH
ncbi:NAD(P)-binding protein [Mycena venus]|uniref:NAD(P)-binding protein n=1 Tax=Mycena venus TaxID=2733690 RepID=A0A8H7D7H7_9AGAR|nr:NAD(P)-binding protein [Mycena venus]